MASRSFSPDPSVHIRANFRTTVGAKAQAYLSICGREGLLDSGATVCATGVEVDASIVEGSVDFVFLPQGSTRLLQPILWFGVGARSYDFDTDLPACEPINVDALEICLRGREMFESPSVNPLVSVGAGVTTRPAPISAFVQIRAVMTGYSGGVGLADGERVTDVLLQGGVSVRVR